MRLSPLALALAVLSLSSACVIVIDKTHDGSGHSTPGRPDDTAPPLDDTGTACTDIAFASVVVHVVDADGEPLVGADVTYTVDGGPSMSAECDSGAGCSSFIAGWEVAGDFVVTADITVPTEDPLCFYGDLVRSTVTVPLTDDGCHVVTQELTVALNPVNLYCE